MKSCVAKMRPERKSALAKEWLLLLAGLVGIAYQLITDDVNLELLLVFTAMTGVPGLAHVLSLIRNSPIVVRSSSSASQSQGSVSEQLSPQLADEEE